MNEAALICSAAAQFYREHPELWLQGVIREGDRRCLVSAVNWASLEYGIDPDPAFAAITTLAQEGPAAFNDAPGRTVGQVIELLDRAAADCHSRQKAPTRVVCTET